MPKRERALAPRAPCSGGDYLPWIRCLMDMNGILGHHVLFLACLIQQTIQIGKITWG